MATFFAEALHAVPDRNAVDLGRRLEEVRLRVSRIDLPRGESGREAGSIDHS